MKFLHYQPYCQKPEKFIFFLKEDGGRRDQPEENPLNEIERCLACLEEAIAAGADMGFSPALHVRHLLNALPPDFGAQAPEQLRRFHDCVYRVELCVAEACARPVSFKDPTYYALLKSILIDLRSKRVVVFRSFDHEIASNEVRIQVAEVSDETRARIDQFSHLQQIGSEVLLDTTLAVSDCIDRIKPTFT